MTRTLEVLERLIAFETVSAQSNLALVRYVEEYLAALGFRLTRLPSPCGEKAGIFAEIGPAGRGIVLSAHTDVVPTTGQNWTRPAFRLTEGEGRLYGRGTTDMKGFVACTLAAAERAAQADLAEPFKIVLSYDEEVGCVGMSQMQDDLAPLLGQPHACIVGEPTQMQVAVGHKGKAAINAVFHGQAGHSALAPRFVNALHLAADFMASLRDLQLHHATKGAQDAAYDVPYSTFHVGKLSGGTALNIVPDRAEMLFEFRHLAADTPETIHTLLRDAAARVERDHPGGQITLQTVTAYPGLDTDQDSDVVSWAKGLAQAATTKVPYGTEAGFFAAMGCATVVCGPGCMEGQGHKPDEYIERSQLEACDRMMDRLLAGLQA